ncbi:MAG: hypothetical protein QM763_21470 [Agriterribacter sp.]
MKKLTYQSILYLGIFVMLSCNQESSTDVETQSEIKKSEINFPKVNESKAGMPIPIATAQRMIGKYLLSKRYIRHRRRSSEDWRDDTRCVWYDSLFVENFYAAFKAEKADGVRVYFGVYDNEFPDKELYKTVIFSTTQKKTDAIGDYHEDILTNEKGGKEKLNFWDYQIKGVYDNGGLCPPPTPCRDRGALLLPTNQ